MKNDSIEMKKGIEKQGKCDYSSIWKENSIENGELAAAG